MEEELVEGPGISTLLEQLSNQMAFLGYRGLLKIFIIGKSRRRCTFKPGIKLMLSRIMNVIVWRSKFAHQFTFIDNETNCTCPSLSC